MGFLNATKFSIDNQSKILNVLRNIIYSDPIQSICREISCNAREAHAEAGNSKRPIEIYLPEIGDMFLRIKDYGLGISPEKMKSKYINYTTDDNTKSSGLSLGAKSPFSYTDIFTVVTNVQGIKYQYINYIDESGDPSNYLLDKEKTKCPDGTEIIIPVKKEHINNFYSDILVTTKYWKIKPKVFVNGSVYNHFYDGPIFTVLSGKNWTLLDSKWNANLGLIINDIYYNVDKFKLNVPAVMNNLNLIINIEDANLIELSLNKEMISYSKETVNYLESLLSDISLYIINTVNSKINDENKFNAVCEYIRITNHVNLGIEFHIDNYNIDNEKKKIIDGNIKIFKFKENNGYSIIDNSKFNVFSKGNFLVTNDMEITLSKKTILSIKNSSKFIDGKFKNLCIIKPKENKSLSDFTLHISHASISEFVTNNASKNNTTKKVFKFNTHTGFNKVKLSSINNNSKIIFSKMSKYDGNNSFCEKNFKYFNITQDLIDMGYSIYGSLNDLSDNDLNKIFKSGYVTFSEAVNSLSNVITEDNYLETLYCKKVLELLKDELYFKQLQTLKEIDYFNGSLLEDVSKYYDYAKNIIKNNNKYVNLAKHLYPTSKLDKYIPKVAFDFNLTDGKIKKQYPLLKFLSSEEFVLEDSRKDIIDALNSYIVSKSS